MVRYIMRDSIGVEAASCNLFFARHIFKEHL
jgi:hypothetical protein